MSTAMSSSAALLAEVGVEIVEDGAPGGDPRLVIDEAADQPGAGDPVDMDAMAGDPDAALQIVDGIPRHLNLDRRGHDVLPEGFLQPGEQPIGGLAAVGAEEVDGHDLGLPGL